MITVWGLKNCDTCKKARTWLEGKGASFAFKDVRADGLTADRITEWLAAVGADTLINRRGTTWRGLPAEVQAAVARRRASHRQCRVLRRESHS